MEDEKRDPDLSEILRSGESSGDEDASRVESLADSLGGEEPAATGRRTLTFRYDTLLLLLIVVLVMMVVSYVLGVKIGGERQPAVELREGANGMSIHKSLKVKSALERHRNVLSRPERIAKLEEEDRWTEGESSVYGLPKVRHMKLRKKAKVSKAEGEGEGTEAAGGEAAEASGDAKK